jgi:hypothetical protein
VAVTIVLAAVALGAQDASPVASELRSKLEHRVQDVAAHVDGVVGYEILDLTSGDRKFTIRKWELRIRNEFLMPNFEL